MPSLSFLSSLSLPSATNNFSNLYLINCHTFVLISVLSKNLVLAINVVSPTWWFYLFSSLRLLDQGYQKYMWLVMGKNHQGIHIVVSTGLFMWFFRNRWQNQPPTSTVKLPTFNYNFATTLLDDGVASSNGKEKHKSLCVNLKPHFDQYLVKSHLVLMIDYSK